MVSRPAPKLVRELAARDPALGRAMQRTAPFPGFPRPDQARRPHFHALARAIVFQQLAGKAAETIHGRVVALTPGSRFPTPREVLELSDERLRGAGLSRNKLLALRDLAGKIDSGELAG